MAHYTTSPVVGGEPAVGGEPVVAGQPAGDAPAVGATLSIPKQLSVGMIPTAARDHADDGDKLRVSKFSFNPAAKEFTPSSLPSGLSGPSATMSPQARSGLPKKPEWKLSNKISGEYPAATSSSERKKVSNKMSPWLRNTPPTGTSPGGSGANSSSTSFQGLYPLLTEAPVIVE